MVKHEEKPEVWDQKLQWELPSRTRVDAVTTVNSLQVLASPGESKTQQRGLPDFPWTCGAGGGQPASLAPVVHGNSLSPELHSTWEEVLNRLGGVMRKPAWQEDKGLYLLRFPASAFTREVRGGERERQRE